MSDFNLIVIGAGPGGYIAAIRAAQLRLKTACVESEERLGGTCLRVGCIPSKAMLEASERYFELKNGLDEFGIKTSKVTLDLPAMLKRKDEIVSGLTGGIAGLFKKNKVTRLHGHGSVGKDKSVTVASPDGSAKSYTADNILIATGSSVATFPFIEWDGKLIGGSAEALSFSSVPKSLAVIGAGYIGLEMGSVWSRLGSKVTVFEYLPRILPGMDSDISADAEKIFSEQGLEFRLGTTVKRVYADGKSAIVQTEDGEDFICDRVLVSVGRKPNTEGLGLENVGIETDTKGFIPVDSSFRTVADGVYAIGDVIGGAMLAHKAEEEGVACVEGIVTGYGHVNYDAIPGVVYTNPEIASVGKSEDRLKEDGIPYRKGVFHFKANGRARCIGDTEGKVKMLAHAETDRILGVHIIGPHAGDLIAEAAVAIEFGASSEDIARSSHAHPTLAEAIKEAALAVDGRMLNS